MMNKSKSKSGGKTDDLNESLEIIDRLQELQSLNTKKRDHYYELISEKNYLEKRRAQLQQDFHFLLQQKKSLQEKASNEEYTVTAKLWEHFTQAKTQAAPSTSAFTQIEVHKRFIAEILVHLRYYLKKLLDFKCSSDKLVDGSFDAKHAYRVYGLLLSACGMKGSDEMKGSDFKTANSEKIDLQVTKIIKEVTKEQAIPNEGRIKECTKADELTYKMLTLLPPLVVTTHPWQYQEELHEISRMTWDHKMNGKAKLIYYRPVLVFGNQLHVAIQGLIGNCTSTTINPVVQYKDPPPPTHPHSAVSEQTTSFLCVVCKKSSNHGQVCDVYNFIKKERVQPFQGKVHQRCYCCNTPGCPDVDLIIFNEKLLCFKHLNCPFCRSNEFLQLEKNSKLKCRSCQFSFIL